MDLPVADPYHVQTLATLRYLTESYLRASHQATCLRKPHHAARLLESVARTRAQARAISEARTTCLQTRLARAYASQDEARIVDLETAIGGIAMQMARWPLPDDER